MKETNGPIALWVPSSFALLERTWGPAGKGAAAISDRRGRREAAKGELKSDGLGLVLGSEDARISSPIKQPHCNPVMNTPHVGPLYTLGLLRGLGGKSKTSSWVQVVSRPHVQALAGPLKKNTRG